MAAILTIAQIIDVAKVSQYMVNCACSKGQLYGKKLDPDWGKTLYMERKSVEWMYSQDPTYSTLRQTANYLYQLCYKASQALAVVNGGGGGTPVSPTSGATGQYYILTGTVAATTTAGEPTNNTLTWTNTIMVGATQLSYIMVDGVVETIANGAFTFDPTTGTITRSQVWITGMIVLAPFLRAI